MRSAVRPKPCLPAAMAALVLCVAAAGCGNDRYVTRDELMSILDAGCSTPSALDAALADDAASRQEREQRIKELTTKALTAPNLSERTAAVLATSGDAAGNLVGTLRAIDEAIGVVADNLVNEQTVGYKRLRPVFRDNGQEVALVRDFSQGDLERTGRELDLAIQGRGFFMVKIYDDIGDGVGYTRKGLLVVNADGGLMLTDPNGFQLDPPITVPTDYLSVHIAPDGRVSVTTPGNTVPQEVGVVPLATFTNPDGLRWEPRCALFVCTAASGDPLVTDPGSEGAGTLVQGSLEKSNVDRIDELIRLMVLQNWFRAVGEATDRILSMPAPAPPKPPGK